MKSRSQSQRPLPPMEVEPVSSRPTVADTRPSGQAAIVDRATAPRTTPVDLLHLLRLAIKECGWTYEALEVEMEIDKGYLHRLLNGEKPFQLARLPDFPDDVEARFAARYADALGLIVVAPVAREEAVRQLVSGLMGVLAPQTRRTA